MTQENTITLKSGKTYSLDRHGFLDPPDQWDDDFAVEMAKRTGIHGELTEDHWDFIRYLRRQFVIAKTVPVVVLACAENKLRLGKLKAMFPAGYHRGACKIAGINYKFMYDHNIWLTYETYSTLKTRYNVTQSGFLNDFTQWNPQFALQVAADWDLPNDLGDRHWDVIKYLREFYGKNESIPNVYDICKDMGLTLQELLSLFPEGYRRGACRASGLPFLS